MRRGGECLADAVRVVTGSTEAAKFSLLDKYGSRGQEHTGQKPSQAANKILHKLRTNRAKNFVCIEFLCNTKCFVIFVLQCLQFLCITTQFFARTYRVKSGGRFAEKPGPNCKYFMFFFVRVVR